MTTASPFKPQSPPDSPPPPQDDVTAPRRLDQLLNESSAAGDVALADSPDPVRRTQWARLSARLRAERGEDWFLAHLGQACVSPESGASEIVLIGASASQPELNRLHPMLLRLWQSEDSQITTLRLCADAQPRQNPDRPARQNLDARFCFDRFVVGAPNRFAFEAARRVAATAEPVYNPLFLFGGVGMGKTHLMTAIALEHQQTFPDQRVLYLTAEAFMRRFISALRHKAMAGFKDLFRSIDLLLIDDIHFIANKASTQEEFFHTLNDLVEHGRRVVVASDRPPAEITDLEPRIASRLVAGLVAEIAPADQNLRERFLHQKARQNQIPLDQNVIDFLARHLPLSIRELEGTANRLIAWHDLIKQPLTLDTCRKILRDVLHQPRLRLTIGDIQQAVAHYYRLNTDQMTTASRMRQVARPRQVAMYLCKQLTSHSLPEIGRAFGGRDHTTVLHAVKRVDALCSEDPRWVEDLRRLTATLRP